MNIKVAWRHSLSFARHEIHQHPVFKFFFVLFVFITYTLFASFKFGAREGLLVSVLSWSFFVLCTPIADAGFLFDLPIRLITGVKMLFSEMVVWIIAITLNVSITLFAPRIYDDTILLSLFSHIIHKPFPFWGIIILSAVGTFLSITFGDEILDVAFNEKKERQFHRKHGHKHHLILIIVLFLLIFLLYDFLLNSLGVNIPLF